MVGPAFKTMKSEFVAWQEAISAKKYDLHDEKQHDQPEGAFTQRNMNRSQQSWVKTFMQDVMDEKGQVLFDNESGKSYQKQHSAREICTPLMFVAYVK